ncbi:MAG: glycerol-3-phosphate acyltransferase [Phormidesmis sp.]
MAQVLGAFLIFTLIPALGALPLTGYIVRLTTGKNLKKLGTGNTSVSAAFYHGGTPVGLAAVAAEAFKGISAVLLARHFFGLDPIWPVLSLMFLVMGRYWGSQGAGTTNIAWGFFVYDPIVAGLTFLISFIGFTILRMRQQGKLFVLVLMPVLTALRYPTDGMRVIVVACLSGVVAWIYQKIPDDLDLPANDGESRQMFRFFQGDRALPSLHQILAPEKVGAKAATLSQLHAWGYPVPPGYILPAGDDPTALIDIVFPGIANPVDNVTHDQKVVARSSAVGEDGLTSSAAGQYVSITNITSPAALERAIAACLNAYNAPSAIRYRQDRDLSEGKMNVLVQPHISGQFSGVAFSRDPVAHAGDAVIVEALPGEASQVVSGKITPERYQVLVPEASTEDWHLPEDLILSLTGNGKTPTELIQQVAYLARHIENRFHGIPQDIEWTFDREQLWVLQSRPITTLLPIWTRKIAAEVIPGVIRPLTWSINRPLTCGVWGDLFTTVLNARAADLDFAQTATLHNDHAYFNATLLGEIFTRMGLPPESLEFLTRGASFSKPPLGVTLRNAPGLLRLLRQEMSLPKQFAKSQRTVFAPAMSTWDAAPVGQLSDDAIAHRIEEILSCLEKATYYNILAPLSLAIRQAIFKLDLATLDSRRNPEVMALEDLKAIAHTFHQSYEQSVPSDLNDVRITHQLQSFLAKYGYLSEVATDIAVPTWTESPQPVHDLLTRYLENPELTHPKPAPPAATHWKQKQLQARLDLKGQVAETYNRLLASLRSCFIEIESRWLDRGYLDGAGDIFFLPWDQIKAELQPESHETESHEPKDAALQQQVIDNRKRQIVGETSRWRNAHNVKVPQLVYGSLPTNSPPLGLSTTNAVPARSSGTLQGIGASAGEIEGTILVMTQLAATLSVSADTILVVPYTDAGWSPVLSQIGGLIAEVGGQLSHGAIVAREYGIPAVMDVTDATERLTNGQRVRIDGQRGTIKIL